MLHVHSGLRVLLACSLVTLPLAGCGQVPTQLNSSAASSQVRAASTSSQELARNFAASMKADPEAQVTVRGSVVTVQGPEGTPVQYDFTRTPETGKVVFRAGEYVAEVDYQDTKFVSWRVVAIAVKMIYGGTKAYFWYKKNHTGSSFSREDCVKAVIYGMLREGVGGLPVGFLWKRLFPIVWKWVVGEDPIAPNGLFKRWLDAKDEVVQVLREAETLR